MHIPKPTPNTFPKYYESYLQKLEQDDLLSALTESSSRAMGILESFSEEKQ